MRTPSESPAPPLQPHASQLVLRMFKLQLSMVAWDRRTTEEAIRDVGAALQGAGHQADGPVLQQAKLHFNMLQVGGGWGKGTGADRPLAQALDKVPAPALLSRASLL